MSVTSPLVTPSGDGRSSHFAALGLLAASCVCCASMMVPVWFAGPLVLDEHVSYWIIDSDLPGTLLERSLNYAATPPLASWLQMLTMSVLGKSELTFRLSSAVCALLAVVVVYRVGLKLGDSTCGGVAALLLAMHPEAMDETRIARCYGLVMLMSAILLLATVHWLSKPHSMRHALLWALAATGVLWTHYTSVLLVIICGAAVAFSRAPVNRKKRTPAGAAPLLAGMGLTFLLNLPLIPSVLRLQEWGPALNFSPASPSLLSSFGPFWWAGVPAACVACLLFGRRIVTPARTVRRKDVVLMAFCALLPVAILAAMSQGQMSSLANPRYRVAFAPAAAVFAALLLTSLRDSRGALIGAVTLLGISWMLVPLAPWTLGRLNQSADNDWRLLNGYLAEHANPDDPIFVQGGLAEAALISSYPDDRLLSEYAACRVSRFYVASRHPRYAIPLMWDPSGQAEQVVRQLIDTSGQTDGRFWVAGATDTDLNQASVAGTQQLAIAAGFVADDTQTWPNAVLIRYRKPDAAAPPAAE